MGEVQVIDGEDGSGTRTGVENPIGFYILAKYAYSVSLIFYDSMINDVTTPKRMDDVSSRGFAWGYIGSCVPFVMGLLLILFGKNIGINQMQAMTIAFVISAVWLVSLPEV